ncbi:PREDICTED: tetraspanin-8 [Cyprinodon variegatus]|uniref:tetraspanin-8 n=1 Tax=Cyprinodon variegatus TaxID=28743 RepID=UPI0007426928|nr:PREDICTED: tetraspanin-8 [Cyprinodon variegatus]
MSGMQCIKYAMFIFNFLLWLAGTGVLAMGLWLRFDPRTRDLFEKEEAFTVFLTGMYLLIAAGALMMVVGFLGCCGAIKESPCMLGLFFLFLLLIFAAEAAAGIWAFNNKEKLTADVKEFYRETYKKYQNSKQDALRETLRLVHYALECCGPTGTALDLVKDICPNALPKGLSGMILTLLSFFFLQIFGMIFSMMLCCAIKRSRDFV